MEQMIERINARIDLLEREKRHAEACRNYYNALFLDDELNFLKGLKEESR